MVQPDLNRMKSRFTDRLSRRLKRNLFVEILLKDRRFRIALALASAAFFAGVISIPKVWRSTPADFEPVVKISVIDKVQAWALRRGAERNEAEGKIDAALLSWQTAFANDPGDIELARGWVRFRDRHEISPREIRAAVFPGAWLLRLGKTNQADVPSVAVLYAKCHLDREVVQLLSGSISPLTPDLQVLRVKSLFNLGDIPAYAKAREELQVKGVADSELELYDHAFRAGWRERADQSSSLAALQAAAKSGPHQVLANRLLLMTGVRRKAADLTEGALNALEAAHMATFRDRLLHWKLLVDSGDLTSAVTLMEAYPERPSNPVEVAAWADLWTRVRKEDQAEKLFAWAAANLPVDATLYTRYAEMLSRQRRWADLAGMALQLRSKAGAQVRLSSFAYYLEARADWGDNRVESISKHLSAMESLGQEDPVFALMMCRGLTEMKLGRVGIQLLKRHEPSLHNSLEYLSVLSTAAEQARDEELLIQTTRKAYEAAPNDPQTINNYANALLVGRTSPRELIGLTSTLFRTRPDNIAVLVNHAGALLLNHRSAEARLLVPHIRLDRLTSAEASQCQLVLCELWLQEGELSEAAKAFQGIDRSTLFPSQNRWLSTVVSQLQKPESKG